MDSVLDHVMIRVEDVEESIEWYTTNFAYEEKSRWEAETFTNVFLGPEDVHEDGALLELTYNHDGRTYTPGDAWGHIAVRVNDVTEAYETLMSDGVEDYRDPESCGGDYAFVTDPDGHEIELVERQYGEPWSLDHTMIRIENAEEAIGWYTRKLNYELVRREELETFALYFMKPKNATAEAMSVELTFNYNTRSYEIGDSWGHLAVRTETLSDTWETLVERHAENYRDPASCDNRYAFTKDADGHEIEIVRNDR